MITADDLQGHWCRDWITAPGFEDHTTRVHWLQAGAHYADIRVPLVRPDLSSYGCLAEVPQPMLAPLMEAEGFAGSITVEHSACTWARWINWHGMPDGTDIGAMSWDGEGHLIEDGVQAEYREQWSKVPGLPLRAHQLSADGQTGVLVENDEVFLMAMGPKPNGTSADLKTALRENTADPADIAAHFASIYCLGMWEGSDGVAKLSTNPFCEGQPVLHRGTAFEWSPPTFDGISAPQRLIAA